MSDLVHRGCIRGFMQCRCDSLFPLWSDCRRSHALHAARYRLSQLQHRHTASTQAAATWYRHGRCRRRPRPRPRPRRRRRLPPIPLSPFPFSCSRRVLHDWLWFSQASQEGNDGGIITRIANLFLPQLVSFYFPFPFPVPVPFSSFCSGKISVF